VKEDYARRKKVGRQAAWASALPVEEFNDSYVGRHAEEYLRGYGGDEPFCVFVGFGGPHEPFDAPGEYATMYDPGQAPPAIPVVDSAVPASDFAAYRMRQGRYADSPIPKARSSYASYIPDLDPEDIARVRGNYYGKITLIDHWIGRILGVLEDRGWREDTLVVFWSDHGEMLGDHRRMAKGEFFESVQRVPLMVSWPSRLPRGETSDSLVQLVDIFPTVLEAAGLEVPESCQGRSLFPHMTGQAADERDAVLSEIYLHGMMNFCVRTRSHKYGMVGDGRGFLLFDLEADPLEQYNLCGNPGTEELEGRLRDRLLGLIAGSQHHQ
jgi:choline-sulfatase